MPNFYEIIFVDYGEILLTLNNRHINLVRGKCLFIPGKEEHYIEGKHGIPFNYMNIMFFGKIPESILNIPLSVGNDGYELMTKVKQESVQEAMYSDELTACYLTAFIVYLIRQQTLDIPSNLQDEILILSSYQSETVKRALSVIANEYNKPLDLKKLSLAVGVSVSHLRSLLKKGTGENFSSILHKQRVATAKHLLGTSQLSIEEIAGAVGYSSLPFFFKIFKRLTGMTPKEYALGLGNINE
jgi:AraC-like DNA-binding protein